MTQNIFNNIYFLCTLNIKTSLQVGKLQLLSAIAMSLCTFFSDRPPTGPSVPKDTVPGHKGTAAAPGHRWSHISNTIPGEKQVSEATQRSQGS